jgi:hypothetical protein
VLNCSRLHLHGFIFWDSISFKAGEAGVHLCGSLIGPLSIRHGGADIRQSVQGCNFDFFFLDMAQCEIAIAVRAELVHTQTWKRFKVEG